jgi:hypothetical protein
MSQLGTLISVRLMLKPVRKKVRTAVIQCADELRWFILSDGQLRTTSGTISICQVREHLKRPA